MDSLVWMDEVKLSNLTLEFLWFQNVFSSWKIFFEEWDFQNSFSLNPQKLFFEKNVPSDCFIWMQNKPCTSGYITCEVCVLFSILTIHILCMYKMQQRRYNEVTTKQFWYDLKIQHPLALSIVNKQIFRLNLTFFEIPRLNFFQKIDSAFRNLPLHLKYNCGLMGTETCIYVWLLTLNHSSLCYNQLFLRIHIRVTSSKKLLKFYFIAIIS